MENLWFAIQKSSHEANPAHFNWDNVNFHPHAHCLHHQLILMHSVHEYVKLYLDLFSKIAFMMFRHLFNSV